MEKKYFPFYFIRFMHVCLCGDMYIRVQVPVEIRGTRSSQELNIGSCEPPDMVPGIELGSSARAVSARK